jgi:hypothetical protein
LRGGGGGVDCFFGGVSERSYGNRVVVGHLVPIVGRLDDEHLLRFGQEPLTVHVGHWKKGERYSRSSSAKTQLEATTKIEISNFEASTTGVNVIITIVCHFCQF